MTEIIPAVFHCPNCKNRRDYVNMGSITSDGYVALKRQFGKFTMIIADEYSIVCECGYFIRVENGKIVSTALTGLQLNG